MKEKIKKCIRNGEIELAVLAIHFEVAGAGPVEQDTVLGKLNAYLAEEGKTLFTEEDLDISYRLLESQGLVVEVK